MATHAIFDSKVYLYKRSSSRFWQCSIYLAGETQRISTKEEGLDRAGEFAKDSLLDLRGKARAGEISAEKTFRVPPRQFERECKIITGGGSRSRLRLEQRRGLKHLPDLSARYDASGKSVHRA